MLTTLALAAVDTLEDITEAFTSGLDRIRLELQRRARKGDQVRKMQDSVHRDLERLG